MGSPAWEFDEHFSSHLENHGSVESRPEDVGEENFTDAEEEEELYYQVYFDRTEESKIDESSSGFKVEEVSQTFNADKTTEGECESNDSVSSLKSKNKSDKVSKISNALESAGMSISELKKILKQNSEESDCSNSEDARSSDDDSDDEGSSSYSKDSDGGGDDDDDDDDDMQMNFNADPEDKMITEILKSMPDSPSSWRVGESSDDSFMHGRRCCTNCNYHGHTSYLCPKPRKVIRCILCSREGHRMNKCQEQFCFRCHQEGHPMKQCGGMSVKEYRCLRCSMRGHLVRECPDSWRQYHMTTSWPGRVVGGEMRGGGGGAVHCFNCAKQGHLGHVCKDRRMNNIHNITSPFILKYDYQASTPRPLTHQSLPLTTPPLGHQHQQQHYPDRGGQRGRGVGKDERVMHLNYNNALFSDEKSRVVTTTPSFPTSKRGFVNSLAAAKSQNKISIKNLNNSSVANRVKNAIANTESVVDSYKGFKARGGGKSSSFHHSETAMELGDYLSLNGGGGSLRRSSSSSAYLNQATSLHPYNETNLSDRLSFTESSYTPRRGTFGSSTPRKRGRGRSQYSNCADNYDDPLCEDVYGNDDANTIHTPKSVKSKKKKIMSSTPISGFKGKLDEPVFNEDQDYRRNKFQGNGNNRSNNWKNTSNTYDTTNNLSNNTTSKKWKNNKNNNWNKRTNTSNNWNNTNKSYKRLQKYYEGDDFPRDVDERSSQAKHHAPNLHPGSAKASRPNRKT